MALRWLTLSDVQAVTDVHNRNLHGLRRWRKNFRRGAAALAAAIDANRGLFAPTALPSKAVLEAVLREDTPAAGRGVFDPWVNWWKGPWAGGRDQYHIWDETVPAGGQYIQPVTQSEFIHASHKNLPDLLKPRAKTGAVSARPLVDLAINVYSAADGVTGWVSKKQHGVTELPHVGYAFPGQKLLLWFTHRRTTGLNVAEPQFYAFFESVSGATYSIRGAKIDLDYRGLLFAEPRRPALARIDGVMSLRGGGIYGDYAAYTPTPKANYPYLPPTLQVADPA